MLAGGLQAAFADFVSNPLPERLAALLCQLRADGAEGSGGRSPAMGQAQQTRRAVLIVEGRPSRSQPHPKSSWRPPAPQPWDRCCRRREPHSRRKILQCYR
jgi:hypothetical protein